MGYVEFMVTILIFLIYLKDYNCFKLSVAKSFYKYFLQVGIFLLNGKFVSELMYFLLIYNSFLRIVITTKAETNHRPNKVQQHLPISSSRIEPKTTESY
jgi:hypothetical protein